MASSPVLSFVIPNFNCGNFVSECIESIISIDFDSFEIVLIDDKSTDNSKDIVHSFAEKVENITIISNSYNQGVSACRNRGIKESRGKYIWFVDSDDYLLSGNVNEALKKIVDNENSDIVLINSHVINRGKEYTKTDDIFDVELINTIKDTDDVLDFLYRYYEFNVCWRNIYKRTFIEKNNLRFLPNVNSLEDQEFSDKALCLSESFSFHLSPIYCYRSGTGNLSHKMGYSTSLSFVKVIASLSKFLQEHELSSSEVKFIGKKLKSPFNELIPRLICLNGYELNNLSKYISENLEQFLYLNNIVQNNTLLESLKENGAKKGLFNYKNYITSQVEIILNSDIHKEIFLFCVNGYSLAVSKVAHDLGVSTKGFFDNNAELTGKYINDIEVFMPEFILDESSNKVFVMICHPEKDVSNNICRQLKKLGLSEDQFQQCSLFYMYQDQPFQGGNELKPKLDF